VIKEIFLKIKNSTTKVLLSMGDKNENVLSNNNIHVLYCGYEG
jgi:hypothetical protein